MQMRFFWCNVPTWTAVNIVKNKSRHVSNEGDFYDPLISAIEALNETVELKIEIIRSNSWFSKNYSLNVIVHIKQHTDINYRMYYQDKVKIYSK